MPGTTLQQVTAGTGADTRVNENFQQVSPAALYARDPVASVGLTWGYKGGQFFGASIADGTVALTASTTNYVVANRSTGAVSGATTTTNWNDAVNYQRLYSVVTGTASVTSSADYRQIIGVGAALASVNVFTKNQSTAPVALTDAATVALDASLSNSFELLATSGIGATRAIGNATNSTGGMVLYLFFYQDAIGSRALTWSAAYQGVGGGAPPAASTAANAIDLYVLAYSATKAKWIVNQIKGS